MDVTLACLIPYRASFRCSWAAHNDKASLPLSTSWGERRMQSLRIWPGDWPTARKVEAIHNIDNKDLNHLFFSVSKCFSCQPLQHCHWNYVSKKTATILIMADENNGHPLYCWPYLAGFVEGKNYLAHQFTNWTGWYWTRDSILWRFLLPWLIFYRSVIPPDVSFPTFGMLLM